MSIPRASQADGQRRASTASSRTASSRAASPRAASSRTASARTGRPRAAQPHANGLSAAGRGRLAAWQAISDNTVQLPVPVLGVLTLPSPQSMAYYGGLAVLGVAGIVDWPVAVVLAAGHLLAEDHHHRLLSSFGEALAEA